MKTAADEHGGGDAGLILEQSRVKASDKKNVADWSRVITSRR